MWNPPTDQRRGRPGAGPVLFLLFLLLTGCATPPQTARVLDAPPEGLPQRAELETVPFFPQERYQCGPAALATVLRHQDVAVTPDELVDEVYLPERKGSLAVELLAAARQRDRLAVVLPQELDAVLQEVAAGQPVLVLQNLGLSWAPRWHFAVVVGYDLRAGEVVLRSGTDRRRVTDLAVFERTWARGDRWAAVFLPPSELPTAAGPLPVIRAARDLEQVGRTDAARTAYAAAYDHWPERPLTALAWANRLYADGRYGESEAVLRELLEGAPRRADAWNNLAYALSRQGCGEQALAAVRCAVALEPDREAFRHSLQELQGKAAASGRCRPVRCPEPLQNPR